MPYQEIYVPAAVAVEHGGVTVYHTYKDNDVDQGSRSYWFALKEDADETDADDTFDVRALPNWRPQDKDREGCEEYVFAILREAIDLGHIKALEVDGE